VIFSTHQYDCRWPDVIKRPPSDPVFNLPIQTLQKLKPVRDLWYLLRSIPDLAQFRVSYMLIKIWAKERGIYAAKFGYLGGIHISVMLVRICKVLLREEGVLSTPDVICTFFDHYANFNWKTRSVFDPFFHKELRYTRTFREPMCLLGWHGPVLNTITAASIPTVRTIAAEIKRAADLLANNQMTWDKFLRHGEIDSGEMPVGGGVCEFLKSFKTYIRINLHYWGASLEKGSTFVGWLESRCVALLVGTLQRPLEKEAIH
jgi:hypothetical protein